MAHELDMACSLAPGELDSRVSRWQDLIERSLLERTETESGVRMSFRPEPGVEQELRTLAELERECCAFACFEVDVTEQAVILDVSAATEAVPTVREMFAAAQTQPRAATARATSAARGGVLRSSAI